MIYVAQSQSLAVLKVRFTRLRAILENTFSCGSTLRRPGSQTEEVNTSPLPGERILLPLRPSD